MGGYLSVAYKILYGSYQSDLMTGDFKNFLNHIGC